MVFAEVTVNIVSLFEDILGKENVLLDIEKKLFKR